MSSSCSEVPLFLDGERMWDEGTEGGPLSPLPIVNYLASPQPSPPDHQLGRGEEGGHSPEN